MTDQDLLRRYANDGCDAAFAALVQRHVDLVYSAAVRMVVDPHLAEDVTQAVFLAAARNAAKLAQCAVLSGWLHRTTRNQAAMTVRSEVRRRSREREASPMKDDSSEDADLWEHVAPHLDDALTHLRPADRDALLLRFFERKTAREIGTVLGMSEEAAQKRVTRALDRLRTALIGRGVVVRTASLAGIVSLQAVQAAPPALAGVVTATAFSTAAAMATGSTFGILSLMATTPVKLTLASLITAGLATTLVMQQRTNSHLRERLAALDLQLSDRNQAVQAPTDRGISAEELARLRAEHLELLRLRGEVTDLRRQNLERAAAAAAAANVASRKPAERPKPGTPAAPAEFVSSENWTEVGSATPDKAFQSFMAALKGGDRTQISSKVHWDVKWKNDVTDEDKRLVEKSMEDYLEMLERAPQKLSAFSLATVPTDDASERTRVYFRTLTADGSAVDSNFEMIRVEGQWKPVLSMRWMDPNNATSFATSPVFGPAIDLSP